MNYELNGRKAVVTGGSKGLGFATASALIAEGASVVICARNANEVEAATAQLRAEAQDGQCVKGFAADMSEATHVTDFINKAADFLGGVDIVINNAGGAHPGNPESIEDGAFIADFDIKVMAWQRVINAALPYLRASDQARVINIGAVYGQSPDPAFFATSVLRGADENLTKTWAAHLAPDGILVNQVNIGVIVTPQWENIRNMRAPELSMEEFFAKTVAEDIPLGRVGQPEELADVVTFLASARSSYITGSSINVAGGMGLRF